MGNIVTIANLMKRYRDLNALNGLNLSLDSGKIIGLLGENGSGKTTLLKILAGLITDYDGDVQINGLKPGAQTKASVSYLPDTSALPRQITITQAIDLYHRLFADFDRARAEELIAYFELPTEKRLNELSLGMAEKVQISLALARKAKLYLLDEPLSGVDPAAREQIMRGILTNYTEDALMIISTHLVYEIEPIIDSAIFLRHGKILLQGDVDDLRTQSSKNLEDLFKEVYTR